MERAVISDWRPIGGPDLAVFRIRRLDGRRFSEFRPGQHVRLASPAWQRCGDGPKPRDYSIGSPPHGRHELEFYVTLVRDVTDDTTERLGSFTRHLFDMKVGDELLCGEPAGRFTLDRTDHERVFLVASGTGLAPFVSMIKAAQHRRSVTDHGRFTLLHGVRYSRDLGYREELEQIAAAGFGLVYLPTVSRPDEDPDWTPELGRGRVNDLLRRLLQRPVTGSVEPVLPAGADAGAIGARLDPERTAVYLCGNSEMIADCSGALSESGYRCESDGAQVLTEDYW